MSAPKKRAKARGKARLAAVDARVEELRGAAEEIERLVAEGTRLRAMVAAGERA